SVTYTIMRWQRVILQQFFFKMARARPQKTKENLIEMTRSKLPGDYDVKTHFTPDYNPWDQRLCLVPDDDLFEAISSGRASVVTDEIETFTETGVKLKSGKELDADIIITATGLILEVLGGAKMSVDGHAVNIGETFSYKGMMYDGVPNMASVFGYTNASWTLRADLISEYVCRVINHMDKNGFAQAVPHNDDPAMEKHPYLDFSSGYVKRAEDTLPKQGSKPPWRHPQNYAADLFGLRYGKLEDGVMEFKQHSAADADSEARERSRIAAE
ncbi:Flavin-binding family monooxygenase, partial [hydrothermal vent metagenome]